MFISDYLILSSYAEGGMGEILKSRAAEVRGLLIRGLLIQTGSYVDKMVKPDWSNFPRHIERDLDKGLLL